MAEERALGGLGPPWAAHAGAAGPRIRCGGRRVGARPAGPRPGRGAGGLPMPAPLRGRGEAAGGAVPAAVGAGSLRGTVRLCPRKV